MFWIFFEADWGVCSREQVLMHPEAGVKVPIELQNQSITVRGWIRAVSEQRDESVVDVSHAICAVKIWVHEELQHGPIGWNHVASADTLPSVSRIQLLQSRACLDPSTARHWSKIKTLGFASTLVQSLIPAQVFMSCMVLGMCFQWQQMERKIHALSVLLWGWWQWSCAACARFCRCWWWISWGYDGPWRWVTGCWDPPSSCWTSCRRVCHSALRWGQTGRQWYACEQVSWFTCSTYSLQSFN